MWLSHYRLTRLSRVFAGKSGAVRQDRHQHVPLTAEQLEDRTTPATITPTTFADGIGIGSLRDAILQADSNGQNNTIMLSTGSYNLSVAGRNESAGQTGDLNLTASGFTETIQGAGATIVNASQIDRVFEIMSNVTVILNNLTVTGGLAIDGGAVGGSDALGGGILNNGGNVTLNNAVVTGNTAQANQGDNACGGGIYSSGGSLTRTDSSTITSNSALAGQGANGNNGQTGTNGSNGGDAQGGGLYVSGGTLTITDSIIRNNVAKGGDGGNGGNGNGVVNAGHRRGPFFTTGPFFSGGFTAPTVTRGFTGNSRGFTGGGFSSGGFTGGGFTGGGFTGGGFTGGGGGFTGGGGSGGSGGGGSSLRAAPQAGHGGTGGVGGRAQGGGLYVGSGSVHISATTFTGNSVTGGNGGNGGSPAGLGGAGGDSQGGGLFIGSGSVDLLNSNLTGNVANQPTPSLGTPGGVAPLGQGPNVFAAGGTVDTTGSTIGHKSKVGVVRPGDGGMPAAFTLDAPGSGISDPSDPSFTYGLSTDQVFAGDWNGDGSDKIGVARPDGGSLVFALDTNGDGVFDAGDQVFHFGLPGDQVVVGDWNGAGKSEIGIVRPTASGELQWVLDTNGDGVFDSGDQVFTFGLNGDTPVVGDWNGAGKSEIGVARPNSNGSLVWALDTNGDGVFDAGDAVYTYGAASDHPIVGDWTASGRDAIGVYRPDPAHNTQVFTLDANDNGVFDTGDQIFTFGEPGDTVIVGKWKPPGQPLQAAGEPPAPRNGRSLTTAELAPLVNEATDIWMATGLDAQQIDDLQHLTVQVGPLRNGLLGYRVGETLTLSPNADGYGWFVDPTPADNSEFPVQTAIGLQAVRGSPAAGRMDLLTAVLHEEGHALGLGDLNPSTNPNDVMTGTLAAGIRRLPRPGEAG